MKYLFIKRYLDILFTFVTSPILILISFVVFLILKIESPYEKTIFKQKRIGRKSKIFIIYKFRTMKSSNNPTNNFTDINDNRVTRFGSFLRIFRLDEVPQFINILKGDMSLIGPRPEQPHYVDLLVKKYGESFNDRHKVLPGITGLAQVNHGYVSDLDDYINKINYDLDYVNNISIFTDTIIFFKTFFVLIYNKGAR